MKIEDEFRNKEKSGFTPQEIFRIKKTGAESKKTNDENCFN